MTSDDRSPAEIEREIEEEREELTANIDALQDKFSIDTLVRQIGDQFREHGGDMGRSIANQVKANPIPLALTGIGLAWLMVGNSGNTPSRGSGAEDRFRQRQLTEGRPYVPPVRRVSTATSAGGPAWARDDDDYAAMTHGDMTPAGSGEDNVSIGDHAASVGSSARDRISSAASKASEHMSAARSSASEQMKTARERLSQGTENLSEAGRDRVIAAREKAVEMRRKAAETSQRHMGTARDFYDDQPLVVGALALAIGAAMGGALPRTKTEDDLMGRQSDDLIAEAERVFQEEKEKAQRVASAVGEEAKNIADETKREADANAPKDQSAVEAAAEKAESAAQRVADTARSEAQKEGLGKPKT
ncbi:MAG: DUF3618 domain-containing protein [Paracoccaceae bacterium]